MYRIIKPIPKPRLLILSVMNELNQSRCTRNISRFIRTTISNIHFKSKALYLLNCLSNPYIKNNRINTTVEISWIEVLSKSVILGSQSSIYFSYNRNFVRMNLFRNTKY